jgi:hypothetical protein
MKKLDFCSPFWQWGTFCGQDGGIGFANCFAAVYMHIQGVVSGSGFCGAKGGLGCNDCGNCSDGLNNLFAGIAGQWTCRQSFSGEKTEAQKINEAEFGSVGNPTDKLVDFIFGFIGYEYAIVSENFEESVAWSIDGGVPIIAKVKDGYRVIIGYGQDGLSEPDYAPVVGASSAIKYDEIERLFVFGESVSQKYTAFDFLRVIERTMELDAADGVWAEFLRQFDYDGERLWEVSAAEIKRRFERLKAVMEWVPNIGHGLQTAFRDRKILAKIGLDERFGELFDVINCQADLLHGRGYMLTAICDCAIDLEVLDNAEWPWDKHGLITAAREIILLIMDCDLRILEAVKKAISLSS